MLTWMRRSIPVAHLERETGVIRPRLRLRPDALLDGLLARPGALRLGLTWLFVVASAYAVAILLLGVGGGSPGIEPWLAIPKSTYFYWESLFAMPVIVG